MRLVDRPVYEKPTQEDKANDQKYLKWLRDQPSALSGLRPCIAAHYRTSRNSGTGTKPLFSALPLTVDEHNEQHRIGQFAFRPREWWEEQTSKYLAQWRLENERR